MNIPDRSTIDSNAINYALEAVHQLICTMSNDRSANHFNPQFPHEYVKGIVENLRGIRSDLKAREGTPGFGKLRDAG